MNKKIKIYCGLFVAVLVPESVPPSGTYFHTACNGGALAYACGGGEEGREVQ